MVVVMMMVVVTNVTYWSISTRKGVETALNIATSLSQWYVTCGSDISVSACQICLKKIT